MYSLDLPFDPETSLEGLAGLLDFLDILTCLLLIILSLAALKFAPGLLSHSLE
jgi:hypothetical protein